MFRETVDRRPSGLAGASVVSFVMWRQSEAGSRPSCLTCSSWDRSPLAALVEVVGFSHELGACKPDRRAYAWVLDRLDVPAARAAYVGDGSSEELVGARAAGFASVILAEEAPARLTPHELVRLRAQADRSVGSPAEISAILKT
jgi:FMN phosphatase YigB (HAD superfamily)